MRSDQKLLGILGGMGPVTTARFLSSIYAFKRYQREQEMPGVVVYSDPSFPDRTSSFLSGDLEILLARTTSAIERLHGAGIDKAVLCCFTLHHIVEKLPPRLTDRLVLLTDVALEAVSVSGDTLLLCTNGSRELRVFERCAAWGKVKDQIQFPTRIDQDRVHALIYKLKSHFDPGKAFEELSLLCKKYQVKSVAFGCTDLHLLSNGRGNDKSAIAGISIVDPLMTIIERLHSGELFA